MNCFNATDPISHSIVSTILGSSTSQTITQFLLDCSVIPDVIRAALPSTLEITSIMIYFTLAELVAMRSIERGLKDYVNVTSSNDSLAKALDMFVL